MDLLSLLLDARNAQDDGRPAALAALLAAHAGADLIGLENEAITRTEAIAALDAEARTDADADALESLVDVIESLRSRQSVVAEARDERNRRTDEALARAARPAEPDPADPPAGDVPQGDPAAVPEAVVPDSPAALTLPVPVAAAVRRAPLGALPSERPVQRGPGAGTYTIEAAAEMPGVSAGGDLGDITGLARAIGRRIPNLAKAGNGKTVSAGLATIRRNLPESTRGQGVQTTDGGQVDVLSFAQAEQMFDERNLPGNSLIAAGGWCAPSTVLYDLCGTASLDGLLDHPTVTVTRGGLRWPQTPDFSAVYGAVGFHQTETQAAAGTAKGCYDVPCPPFSEARLEVEGICLRAGILTANAYPELIQYYVEQSMAAHAHKINAFKLAQMQAQADDVVFTGGTPAGGVTPYAYGPGATASVLDALEISALDMKYKYRLPLASSLEVIMPAWAIGVIRSDLSKRTGINMLDISEAQITEWFNTRHMAPQFVYDWHDALTTSGGAGFGGATPLLVYPATIPFLLYPAGSFVIGQADVIDLSAIYDSTGLNTNSFTRLFFEEGILVGSRCYQARYITVDTCPDGLTGGYIAPPATRSLACPAA